MASSKPGKGNGTSNARQLLSFPCRYDLKVIGRQSNRFEAMAQGIVTRHIEPHDLLAVTRRLSGRENYLALTFIINAQSYQQLDNIYRALSACEEVLFSI
jgi:putative lipoic acid-binding regulatory protein